MLINKKNLDDYKTKLMKLNDESIEKVFIDYDKKNIELILTDFNSNSLSNINIDDNFSNVNDYFSKYTLLFKNCILFISDFFDSWGNGKNIFEINIIDNNQIKRILDNGQLFNNTEFKFDEIIALEFVLKSGNSIKILCKELVCNEQFMIIHND
jgi:hypothetical protein